MERHEITIAVAARLVAEQFPQWADLPLAPVPHNGWDNRTFRLGDTLSVRLPSGEGYAAQVVKEHRWLPMLARQVPLPIPEPVAMGRPNQEFPWPWSVYRWIEGEPANRGGIADLTTFAGDVAGFLTALYAIDGSNGPTAGDHSQSRGGPLVRWDEWTRESIRLLAGDVDTGAVTEAWAAAVATTWARPAVWVHGDIAGSNLLVTDGELRAVIDFGCCAVGDPACDLAIAWTFFDAGAREEFRRRLDLDEATWRRGSGWALWKALIILGAEKKGDGDASASARGMGWRHGPLEVVDLVLRDAPG